MSENIFSACPSSHQPFDEQKIILPDDVVNYAPSSNEIYSNGIRHIFGDLPLLDSEVKALAKCIEFLKQQNFQDEEKIFSDERNLLRILQGNYWDLEQTLADVRKHVVWRKERLPVTLEQTLPHMHHGLVYLHGRDKNKKPIIIFKGSQMVGVDVEVVLDLTIFWLEFTLKNLFVRNKVEQWLVIFDMENVAISQVPVGTLREVIGTLHKNYRSRLSTLFVVNSGFLFSTLWSAVSYVIPEHTRRKIKVVYAFQELLKQIDVNQLELKYGGSSKNVTNFSRFVSG